MKKLFAHYFPQYHQIELNDKHWGTGFTDWVNVKNAKPQFRGHSQPKVPLNKKYYSLLNEDVIDNQISIAKKYGLDGFNFYHYWFDGKLLLEKPLEIFKKINNNRMEYCLTWANESWTKQWVGSTKVIIRQNHLNKKEIWIKHIDYLTKFFLDKNYIKKNNKPFFCIYRPELIPDLKTFIEFFNRYIIENTNFDGINFIGVKSYDFIDEHNVFDLMDYVMYFQPRFLFNKVFFKNSNFHETIKKVARRLPWGIQNFVATFKFIIEKKQVIDYKKFVDEQIKLIDKLKTDPKVLNSIVVDWDNTARYGTRFKALVNFDLKYFENQLLHSLENSKNDLIFINAWNEWAESAYLEPDELQKFKRLESLKNVLEKYDKNE